MLFLALGWANKFPRQLPDSPEYTTVEVFTAQPLLQEPLTIHEPAPVLAEINLDDPFPRPAECKPVLTPSLEPRLLDWQPRMNLDAPRISSDGVPIVSIGGNSDSQVGANLAFSMSQVDQPPKRIKGMNPVYPLWAKHTDAQGTVDIRFIVDARGNVGKIEVLNCLGNSRFKETTRNTVKTWVFKPAMYQGKPVAVWCRQKIAFRMD
jgi:protein TonB